MKKALIVRYGAYGDSIVISPVIDQLFKDGYYIIFNTTERGQEVYKEDKRIKEIVFQKTDEIPIDNLDKYWEDLKAKYEPDVFINFTGSLEHNVAAHPVQPEYMYTKEERKTLFDKNYYEETAKWAKIEVEDLNPSLYFTDTEVEDCKLALKKDHFNIMWALSGSGTNKVYPWVEFVIGEVLKNYKNIHFITVGDNRAEGLSSSHEGVTNMAGLTRMRVSMCLTGLVDLVIAPDTGVLHAAGCFDTPKIGILGHTTKENITKHFKNDYSVEANCACAPCFRLIYDYSIQCPVDPATAASWCMASLEPERIYEQITRIIPSSYRR